MASVHQICHVFPHEVGDGPANMARDEALLEDVAADPTVAAFRTYGWIVPTLSLGYFQQVLDAESDPRWLGVPLVRRPTGGGAILHDREVTYALVVPPDHPCARHSAALYAAVHSVLVRLLAGRGHAVRRRGESALAADPARPFLCFADRDQEDVILGASKVVGSAQRRRSGATLQHGSILLARSSLTPELAGLDNADPVVDWADRVRDAVPRGLGLTPREVDWPAGIRRRAQEIEREVYRNPAWTRRR